LEGYDRHIFVCLGKRCLKKGSEELLDLFKEEVKARALSTSVRLSRSGCLKACKETEEEGEFSPLAVVYPEGVWYKNLTPGDVVSIVEGHLDGGEPVERLVHFSLKS
jgi:(2Fe-2S) ferredoxin